MRIRILFTVVLAVIGLVEAGCGGYGGGGGGGSKTPHSGTTTTSGGDGY